MQSSTAGEECSAGLPVHVPALPSGLIPLKMQHSDCGDRNLGAAQLPAAARADSGAAAVDCPGPSCTTSRGVILSSGTI